MSRMRSNVWRRPNGLSDRRVATPLNNSPQLDFRPRRRGALAIGYIFFAAGPVRVGINGFVDSFRLVGSTIFLTPPWNLFAA